MTEEYKKKLLPKEDEFQRVSEGCCSPRTVAIVFMNLYAFTSICYQSFAKVATNNGVNSVDVCLIRTFVNFLVSVYTVTHNKKHVFDDVKPEFRSTLLLRSILGVIGFTLMVFATKYLPIFIVTIIFNTSPFWTAIFAFLILSAPIHRKDLLLMIGCFIGVVMIALAKEEEMENDPQTNEIEADEDDGGYLSKSLENTRNNRYSKMDYMFGIFCITTTAIVYSWVSVLTRKLREVHFSVILFHYTSFGSLIIFVYLLFEHFFFTASVSPTFSNLRVFNYSFD